MIITAISAAIQKALCPKLEAKAPTQALSKKWEVGLNGLPLISIEEALDHMGNRFRSSGFEKLLGITFEQYLQTPKVFEAQAAALIAGMGINIVAHNVRIVPARKQPRRKGLTTIEL